MRDWLDDRTRDVERVVPIEDDPRAFADRLAQPADAIGVMGHVAARGPGIMLLRYEAV